MLFFARLSNGEAFIIVFALLMLVVTPLIIVGIIFYVFRRNNKHRAIWNSIASELNLMMPNPKKLEMTGIYNNCQVKLAVGVRGSGDSSETFTYCETGFPHNLRFLLKISSPKGFFTDILSSNQLKLGQVNFDNSFNLKCYDENVLRRLLLSDFPSQKTQNLMGDLMLANQSFNTVSITDKQVYIESSGQTSDKNILKAMLELTTNLANRFTSARESFPLTDWEKNLFTIWQKFAAENNLSFDSKDIVIQGNYKNFSIKVSLETENEKFQTKIHLQFGKSLMVGLKLMPENSLHKAMTWLGVQDIETGIRQFDDTFIVKAENSQMAKHILTPNLCNQLVGLAKQSPSFEINDTEIVMYFEQIFGDEKLLKSNLEAIILTAKMLLRQNS